MLTQRSEENRVGKHASVRERDRESPSALFLHVLSSPGPALCKLGQPGELFVPPAVLMPGLGSSFVLFSRAFPFLVF